MGQKVQAEHAVYALAALYGAFFAFAAATVFWAFQERRYDLGNMTQAVWSTAHGNFLAVTDDAGHATSRLGVHVDPFLALFAPLWRLWPSALLLLVSQAVAVASGAIPVFWLARKHLGSARSGLFFTCVYLLYPCTQFNAFAVANGFHAVSFAIPLILWAIWFMDQERLVSFAILAGLAASTKEEIPMAVGCLGIWYAVRKGRVREGVSIFALGTAMTIIDFFVVIPAFSRHGISPFAQRYAQVGRTPKGIVEKAFTDPTALVHAVATTHKLVYLVLLFLPLLGLWAFEPLLLLGAAPDLAINLLSSRSDQTTIIFQYTAGITPFLITATILGAARLRRARDRLVFCVFVVAVVMAPYSPAWYFANQRLGDHRPASALHAAKSHALRLVPSGAAVAATNQLAGYLSARPLVSLFPHASSATWIVADDRDHTTVAPRALQRALAAVESSPHWRVIYASHGIHVLMRRGPDPAH